LTEVLLFDGMDWLCAPTCNGGPCNPKQTGNQRVPPPAKSAIDKMKKGGTLLMNESLVGVGIIFKHDKHKEMGGGLTVVALVPGGSAVESGQVSVGSQVR
jgi:hypothetical protein